jgi:DNA-binding ferritin-like protein
VRTLTEWIQVAGGDESGTEPDQPHMDLVLDNALAEWSGLPYAELSVLLVHLRFLSVLHQTHHWTAKGDPFYGDHKLFEELYQRTLVDIDDVAEKVVGLGCEQNVNLTLQLAQMFRLNKAVGSPQTVPHSSDLARASLVAECNFLKVVDVMYDCLQQNGTRTTGIENLVPQVADRHERHVYLLKRRCSMGALGM